MPTKSVRLSDSVAFDIRVHDRRDDFISPAIMRDGIWSKHETQIVMDHVKPGDVFVDVGANIGWFSLVAAAIGAEVHAFEPCLENYLILLDNVMHFANVQSLNVAISSEFGSDTLYLAETNLGDHRMTPVEGRTETPIDKTTISNYFDHSIDFIKVDTQGHEGHVFKGMAGYFAAGHRRPKILWELWPKGMAASGIDAHQAIEILRGYGYRVPDLTQSIRRLMNSADPESHETVFATP